jgi:hypothetical protein
MPSILDIYKRSTPKSGLANTKGVDKEPIGANNAFKPSKDLSKNENALKKARGGELKSKKYSDSVKNK